MENEHRNSLVAFSENHVATVNGSNIIPSIVYRSGSLAAERFVEFFAATLRNRNTRDAYQRACIRFLSWCEHQKVTHLRSIKPLHIAVYIDSLGNQFERPTVKQHLAAIRTLFDWLVIGQVVPINPSLSVRGPKYTAKRGKTYALAPSEARLLLDSIPGETMAGLRDRALIGLMLFSFARVGAVVTMQVQDYYPKGKRWWIRLREKGGKLHEMPVHPKLQTFLDSYLSAAKLNIQKGRLFRSVSRAGTLKESGITRVDVYRMVRRRAVAAAING